MDDVRGDFLGPPHGTTPAAVIANKNNWGSEFHSKMEPTNTRLTLTLSSVLLNYFKA